MSNQKELDRVYMEMACSMATLSHGKRAKVGAVAVTNVGVVLTGCNGLPKELGNILEVEERRYVPIGWEIDVDNLEDEDGNKYQLVTKPTVIHAENNILVKAAKEGVSLEGSTVYTTHSCCKHCSSMLASCGVKRVVYLNEYRDKSGIDVLKQCGIAVEKWESINA